MRIQHNTTALNAHRQLGGNNNLVGKNLEKLSSGYRINRAGDDAAGLAISEKMRAQIRGLETAQKNANDGISLVQTAEGALTEVHSMLNRMTELATQASNGTYTDSDRNKLQDEVVALRDEIDRIAAGTNFNDIKLLDGSMGGGQSTYGFTAATIGGKSIGIEGLDSSVKNIEFITSASGTTNANGSAAAAFDAATGKLTITMTSKNGTGTELTAADVTAALKTAGFKDAAVTAADLSGLTTATTAGTVTETKAAKATITNNGVTISAKTAGAKYNGAFTFVAGANKGVTLAGDLATVNLIGADNYTAADINKMLSAAGAEYTVDFDGSMTGTALAATGAAGAHTLAGGAGTPGGGLNLQVGESNDSFQKVQVAIGNMDAATLGIGNIDISEEAGAGEAIKLIKDAIESVSTTRGNLGAIQNRLEHTINNLGVTTENMVAAESRVRDVDMAKEMMDFTKNNILTQAAQAMLAQANQIPQGVLQLLR